MQLHRQSFGTETEHPLLIVHGLFGAGKNWRALARNFAKSRWVVTVDLRNHGQSPWSSSNTYFDLAADLAVCIDELGGFVDVLGHSMGGKAAMVLALQHPKKIRSLIVGDIAPVNYLHSQSEHISVMQKLPLKKISRRSEAQKMLLEQTGDQALAAFFAQNLTFQDGQANWQLNLDALETFMEEIIGFPVVSGSFEGDVFVARGSNSTYVDEAGLDAFRALFKSVECRTLQDAGHWLHADNPHGFIKIVEEFLGRQKD